MARCPSCNRFVPYGEGVIEVESEEVVDETVTVELRVALPCEECEEELREAFMTIELDMDLAHSCCTKPKEELDDETEHYEIEELDEPTFVERLDDRTKTGKKIKNTRYMKKYYGAEITAHMKCNKCGESFEATGQAEEQASAYEEV